MFKKVYNDVPILLFEKDTLNDLINFNWLLNNISNIKFLKIHFLIKSLQSQLLKIKRLTKSLVKQ